VSYKTVRYNNESFPDYVMCEEGNIYNKKTGKMLKPHYRAKGGNNPSYPNIGLMCDIAVEHPDGYYLMVRKCRTIMVHIAVCDTYNRDKMPVPDGVTEKEWKRTPASVKKQMRFAFQVNHKDHDQHNHHPSNLEYTTAKQNQAAYQEHRKKVA
jgi:hypothetical protein